MDEKNYSYYKNPVLPADYSDPDILRVGDDYILITSTFVESPGITVLHSRDLVNWRIIGAAVNDITKISRSYSWKQMQGYGRGIWAPCLTYQKERKRFYIHFCDPDYGMYMTWTENIFANDWRPIQEVVRRDETGFGAGWDDCGVLWDDDGQGYVAVNHFADGYKNYIFKLSGSGDRILDEGVLIHQSGDGLYSEREENPEALKLMKKDGLYYIFHNGVVDGVRKAFMMRSGSIYGMHGERIFGTYEHPGVYEHIPYPMAEGLREPNQGNLVPVSEGGQEKWYFWTHHGLTDLDGRPNSLLPVVWDSDGWPVINCGSGCKDGLMEWKKIKRPKEEKERFRPQTSDDFSGSTLGYQWTWNYQPRDDYWSLKERPGYLRLKAFCPLYRDKLEAAGNSLVQRMYRTCKNVADTRMDIQGMADGQFAGLLYLMGGTAAGFGVYQKDGIRRLRFKEESDLWGQELPASLDSIYLRAKWDERMKVQSFYSLDGITFQVFGGEYQIRGSDYRGGRIGFFNFNNHADEGYVDLAYFRYETEF